MQIMIPKNSCTKDGQVIKPIANSTADLMIIAFTEPWLSQLNYIQFFARKKNTCIVGLKLKRNIDSTIVSNIAMEVEYTRRMISLTIIESSMDCHHKDESLFR